MNRNLSTSIARSAILGWSRPLSNLERTGGSSRTGAVVVNAPAVGRALVEGKYRDAELSEVAALRCLDLDQRDHRPLAAGAVRSSPFLVLPLGDGIHSAMQDFLRALEGAIAQLSPVFELTFNPHHGDPIALPASPRVRVQASDEALIDIMPSFDVAVSINSTAVSVDGFVAEHAAVVEQAGTELNLSALRVEPGIRFASSTAEPVRHLEEVRAVRPSISPQVSMFLVDRALPRWHHLLGGSVPGRSHE